MEIDLKILRSAANKVIDDYIALYGNSSIVLDQNYYWMIMDEDIFNFPKPPDNFGVGSLQEEYSEISQSVRNNDYMGLVSMQHIAYLLLWLSAKSTEN